MMNDVQVAKINQVAKGLKLIETQVLPLINSESGIQYYIHTLIHEKDIIIELTLQHCKCCMAIHKPGCLKKNGICVLI